MRLFIALLFASTVARADLIYSNDFDLAEQFGPGISTSISGGTATGGGIAGGITSSQGYAAYSHFGGDFWRVTRANDVLTFDVSGITPGTEVSLSFSLAMIDSWDGTNGTYGTDIINFAISDGGTQIAGFSQPYFGNTAPGSNVESTVVQNTQLGFNSGSASWWNDDGYRMSFNNLTLTSSLLTVEFWASSGGTGSGFQGGNDESFAIDELSIVSTPEPRLFGFLLLTSLSLCGLRGQRKRAD